MKESLAYHVRRSIFVSLAQMAWADGKLHASELAALRGAAFSLDLLDRHTGVAGMLSLGPALLPPVEFSDLNRTERGLCVAAAAWAALTDDLQSHTESFVLSWLATHAGLDEEIVDELSELAWRTRALRPHDLDWESEFDALLIAAKTLLEPQASLPAVLRKPGAVSLEAPLS
jgi:hypothetical protein